GQPGFYFGAEYVMLQQSKALGNQTIGVRGFFDVQGASGVPGTFVGSGATALDTNKMGPREWQPGFRVTIGYKFDTGVSLYANYMQVYDAHYSSGATQATLGFKSQPNLADTFLSAPVYNFNTAFGGPQFDTALDNQFNGGFNTYGIWN